MSLRVSEKPCKERLLGPKVISPKPKSSGKSRPMDKRIVIVDELSETEQISLISPGQTATDFFRLKLSLMVKGCWDIPENMRSSVIEPIAKDEVLWDDGDSLAQIIQITALRLGLGRPLEGPARVPQAPVPKAKAEEILSISDAEAEDALAGKETATKWVDTLYDPHGMWHPPGFYEDFFY